MRPGRLMSGAAIPPASAPKHQGTRKYFLAAPGKAGSGTTVPLGMPRTKMSLLL
jgi:hypothetical protein